MTSVNSASPNSSKKIQTINGLRRQASTGALLIAGDGGSVKGSWIENLSETDALESPTDLFNKLRRLARGKSSARDSWSD